jgi:hypothetical protein
LTDSFALWGNGPPEYSSVLEPPYESGGGQRRAKFPQAKFPALHNLFNYVTNHPEVSPAYSGSFDQRSTEIRLELQVERMANAHFLRFGEVGMTHRSRTAILRFMFAGLFNSSLEVAVVIPIALTRFDFEHFRLGDNAYIIRMSDALQQARWSGKAYGAKGNDSVLSAATHAAVFTGGIVDNCDHFELAGSLSRYDHEIRDQVDRFFAVLRLETGIETGYAQVIRLARRWRSFQQPFRPEIYAGGARAYPDSFDDFGWIRENIPIIQREQVIRIAALWNRLSGMKEQRMTLALRRFNSAMVRHDPDDAILDATIALEILLGDRDNQGLSWKLRMRAAALAGIDGDKAAMEQARIAVKDLYDLRSAIVHGALRNRNTRKANDPESGRHLAIETVRAVIRSLIKWPHYLKPEVLDNELLMVPATGLR